MAALAETLRAARRKLDWSQRSVAQAVGISAAYMNDIEYDRRLPSDKVLRKIANHLGLEFERLQELTGRIDPRLRQYVRRQPLAGRLFREIAVLDLHGHDLDILMDHVRDLYGGA